MYSSPRIPNATIAPTETGPHEHVERDREHGQADQRHEPHRLAADPVGQRADEGQYDHHQQLADDRHDERALLVQVDGGLQVGRRVAQQGVVDHVERDDQAGELEQLRHVARDDLLELRPRGLLGLVGLLLQLAEDRRVFHLRPQVHPDEAERARHEEGHPPAPGVHGVIAEGRDESQHQQRAAVEARERADLEEAAEEAPPPVGGVLRHERRGAAVFATGREALDDPQEVQQDRRGDADARVGGQEPHEERRRRHQDDRHGQHPFAADLVAEGSPEDPAERPDEEREREADEGEQDGVRRVLGEQRVGDVHRAVGVDAVVEPLDRVADGRRADGATEHGGRMGAGWPRCWGSQRP